MVVCAFPLIVQCYEIEFSRSYSKVMTANNQLVIKINSNGEGSVDFPDFYKYTGQVQIDSQSNHMPVVDNLIGKIKANKTSTSLKTKLAAVEKYHNLPLYYSSDVDLFTLKVTDDNKSILTVSFNNWEELNHRYEYMGDWQPMIDLVNAIQQVSIDAQKQLVEERKK